MPRPDGGSVKIMPIAHSGQHSSLPRTRTAVDSSCLLTSVDSTNVYASSAVAAALAAAGHGVDCRSAVARLFAGHGAHGVSVGGDDRAYGGPAAVSVRPPMSVVVADMQTAGRGRLHRAWYGEAEESLMASFVTVVPERLLGPDTSGWLTTAAGLSVIDAIRAVVHDVSGGRADDMAGLSIKWPNDVFMDGRKLAGILTELAALHGDEAVLVFGIGVNLFVPEDRLPTAQSTSLHLRVSGGRSALPPFADLRDRLVAGIAVSLRSRVGRLIADTETAVDGLWNETRSLSWTLGRHVEASLTDETRKVLGSAIALNRDASLVIETDDGAYVTVTTGDVGVLPGPAART